MFRSLAGFAARRLRRAGRTLTWWAQRLDDCLAAPKPDELAQLRCNAALKDIAAGRPGFIIGNGSSLARQDLGPLAGQMTFVANAFWRHPLMAAFDARGAAWQPAFYTLVDPLYFDGSEPMQAFFTELRARTPSARFVVPLQHLAAVRRLGLLPLERVHPCLTRGDLSVQERALWDLTRPVHGVANVALFGILTAMYAGCRPIYLLGLDHDWLTTPGAECRHFYRGLSVENHAEVAALERGTAHSYRFNVECVLAAFRSYEVIRETARELGIEILNATDGGFLDVFPRVRYEDVIAQVVGARPDRIAAGGPRRSHPALSGA